MTPVLLSLMLLACVEPEPTPAPGAATPPTQQPKTKAPVNRKKPPAKGSPAKGKAKPVGTGGQMEAQLSLTPVPEASKTKATMGLIWDGGEAVVNLGTAPGSCTEVAATPASDGVAPLFRVRCENEKSKADLVVIQAGEMLVVKRSKYDAQGEPGPFVPVRRVRLAKGAELVVDRNPKHAPKEGEPPIPEGEHESDTPTPPAP